MERKTKGSGVSFFWIGGTFTKTLAISPLDSGFTNGLGHFDNMLSIDGRCQYANLHYGRLKRDCGVVLNKDMSLSFKEWSEICVTLLQKNALESGHARIKTIVTGGVADGFPLKTAEKPHIIVTADAYNSTSDAQIKCVVSQTTRRRADDILENCKLLDYTRSFLARREAAEKGADDALFLNTRGTVACASASSIFIRDISGEKLITPPPQDGVQLGVTRRVLIDSGEAIEESITVERLQNAAEIYRGNSLSGLQRMVLV
jgi:branched-chain amino acid aminotransferase